ncbi:MAG: nucleoside hydrolase [Anaerococcus sp.]|uniref:nucleoside hydrolase n=1 Tax=Anaerococcus TaxID=165779 RepID=UPI00235798E7|nr:MULTISPECIES: nucleoside hydrolase [Anaerococcus]MDU4025238.1 nucleoside hydrolase [Anaerococcus sp.]
MDYEKPFIFIDTNFGLDEALMIKMAFNSFDFEILGMSTSDGKMNPVLAAENIVGLSTEEGLFLPVAAGKPFSDYHHLDKEIFSTTKYYIEKMPAYENIIDKAEDCGRLDIIATSGLTNIAKALEEAPEIEDYISHIFILGGETDEEVSGTFIEDPEAVDKILNTSIDLFLLPLGIANEPLLSDDMIVKLYGKDKNLDTILDEFKNEPLENRLLKAPLLLYLTQAPEAFIFEESGFGVITSDLEGEVGSLYRTNSRKKNYRVTRVNEEVFYDFLLGSL